MYRLSMIIWAILCFSFKGMAQNVTLSVSSSELGLYEDLTLTVSVQGDEKGYEEPRDLQQHFKLLGPPSTYSQTSIINGDIRVEKRYQYQLRPREKGTFTLGPAKARFNDEWVTSNTVQVRVVEQRSPSRDPNDPRSIAANLAHINVLVNKRKAYIGEPIVGRYVIRTQTRIEGFESLDEPDLKGFLREDIEQKKYRQTQEVIDGKQVTTVDISQFLLIPQSSGTFDPGELRMRIPTQIPTNQRDFFGNRVYRTIDQVSEARFPRVEVVPLPSSGRPESFDGAVGDYELEADLSRTSVKANESVTLTVRLTGQGNIRLQNPPVPELPPSLEAYDPTSHESVSVSLSGMRGRKTIEYVIVPRYKGTYRIPEMKFSYFDPSKEDYVELSTGELTIEVTTGEAPPAPASNGDGLNRGSSVDFLNKDILFIHEGPIKWKEMGSSSGGKIVLRALWTAGFLVWLLIILWFRFRGRIKSAMTSGEKENALRKTRKHLAKGRRSLREGRMEEANHEILSALDEILYLGTGKKASEVSDESWVLSDLTDEENQHLKNIRMRASMFRYSPVSAENMDRDVDDLEKLIKKLHS